MAKMRYLIGALFSLILVLGYPYQSVGKSIEHQQNTLQLRKQLQKTYTSQIGVRELTGKNDGTQVEQYLKYTKLGKGYAWCAAFVCWSMGQNAIQNPRSAWSPDLFPSAKVIYQLNKGKTQTPIASDVFGIYFKARNRIAHVGFIDDWPPNSSYATTVEGNTNEAGSREGDGVYRKKRLKRQIYAVSRYI